MPEQPPPPESARQQGRRLACEGILRSQFGRRSSSAVDQVMAQLKQEEFESVGRVTPRAPSGGASIPASRLVSSLAPPTTRGKREVTRPTAKIMRWPQVLALAASIVFLVSLGVWFFGPTMGTPTLTQIQGTSITVERGTEFIPATPGMALRSGDVLHTGTNASATVGFGAEQTSLQLAEQTELSLTGFKPGKRFKLQSGKLEADVGRQRPFAPLVISTPNAVATVIGTHFTLTNGANHTRLDVAEGKVRLADTVSSNTPPEKVAAGEYATVAANTALKALPQTGGILCEYWTNVLGGEVNDLLLHPDYPNRPSGRDWVELLEVPTQNTTNYGCRLVGYLHPPVTGDYIFWIAASPGAAFNMSKDEQPANARPVLIRQFDFGSGNEAKPREWERVSGSGSVKSTPIRLEAGKRYFIEAIHKADSRRGHLAIAWTPPGGAREVIGKDYLSPLKPKPKGLNQ